MPTFFFFPADCMGLLPQKCIYIECQDEKMLSVPSIMLQAPTQKSVFSLILTFLGRFITEQKLMRARQHEIHQCSSPIDTVSPPDVFAKDAEMLCCHV